MVHNSAPHSSESGEWTPTAYRFGLRLAGGVLVLLALTVLSGWLLHLRQLVQLIPGYPTMVVNTASAFLLGGIALLLPLRLAGQHRLQIAIGATLTVGALLVLSQDLFDISLGIDFPASPDWLRDPRPHPTRMAPNTALAFALAGLALAFTHLPWRWSRRSVAALSIVVGAIGVVALAGHLATIEFLFSWYPYTRMAVHTAAGFVVFAAGLWLNSRRFGHEPVTSTVQDDRRILFSGAAILIVMAVVAGLTSFIVLGKQTETELKRNLEITLRAHMEALRVGLDDDVNDTRGIASRPSLQRSLRRLQTRPGDTETLRFLRETIASLLPNSYSAVVIRDRNGNEIARTGEYVPQAAVQLALRPGQGNLLLWQDRPLLHIQSAIHDGRQLLGEVITQRPVLLLVRLFDDVRSLGATGEAAICAAHGDHMRCLPTRLNPQAPLDIPRTLRGQRLAMSHALDGDSGVMTGLDYRGRQVVAAYAPVGATGLGMVVKVDADELYEPVAMRLRQVLGLLLALAAFGLLLLRWQVHPLVHRLVRSEADLRDRETRIRAIVEGTTDAVYIKDRQGRYLLINSAGARFLGRTPEEVIGRDDSTLFSPDTAHAIMEGDRKVIESGAAMTYEDVGTAAGVTRTYLSNKAPYRDFVGNIIGLIGISRDITERKQTEETIRSLSLTDELTGLHNRRGFFTLGPPAIEVARRVGRSTWVIFLDLDNMKQINDQYGHAAGDQALVDTAELLRRTFRESDILARLGGDEFAVLTLEMPTDQPDGALARLQENLEACNRAAPHGYTLSLSTGTAQDDPARAPALQDLLAQADAAMYREKLRRRTAGPA